MGKKVGVRANESSQKIKKYKETGKKSGHCFNKAPIPQQGEILSAGELRKGLGQAYRDLGSPSSRISFQ